MTDKTQPEALRALAESAAWTGRWYDAGCNTVHCTYDKEESIEHDEIAHPVPLGVSGYIAAAHPQAVIALLDRIAELEAELEAVGAGGVQALSAAPAGFVPVSAFDRLHAHAESLAARLLAASPTPPAEQQAAPKAAPVVWLSSKQLRGVTALHGQYLPFRRQPEGRFDTPVYLVEAAPKAAPGEPVHGDVLPPVGSRVYIRHGRDNDAHACTVTGYYAWGDLGGDKRLHRVFVRLVYEGTDIQQARMLCDCYPTAEAALAQAAPQQEAQEPVAWMWQHEETGRTGFVDCWQIENGFQENNPQLRLAAKLYATPQPAPAPLSDAIERYLESQDALDNREYAGINAESYEKLIRRRNASRKDLDAALAAREGK